MNIFILKNFTEQTIQFLPLIQSQIKLIRLPVISPESTILKNNYLKERIASLSLKNPKFSFDLSEFTSLTSLSLIIKNHLSVNDFIRNRYHRFEKGYVLMEGFVDTNFINHIDRFNIKKVVVEFDKQEILGSVIKNKELLKRITFCYKECYKKGFNNEILIQYYPEHIKINGFSKKKIKMDFSSYTFIKSIKSINSSIYFNPSISLTHLESKYFYKISSLNELYLQGKNIQDISFPNNLTT
ncbi:hypothetical protein EDI_195140 [Entamoeba dispar SAW760]|uniref:Uncharacterized protein n=1 Tax=Entamoeba dispar (strain ATCC PRA-260 / SAW760) TaxID=370354 RepID=B0EIZ4_ENTDS|nr:uncharacterized protein EDI_195140 [Entamoeba dispar SAW760]EDR25496.1 hypothetical protein EDI_195140 [Entamoeba dispar SAW760]|eukprot:EDR25496.1 hypothetical protein EDI_195140 [Entamoeba dispar SAW760]